ncbi:hypothetical protein AAVH_01161 [Aphelenchoides avenae]|nr:hypothetical protein AAVH_01161 [Aphelenchus avenae]
MSAESSFGSPFRFLSSLLSEEKKGNKSQERSSEPERSSSSRNSSFEVQAEDEFMPPPAKLPKTRDASITSAQSASLDLYSTPHRSASQTSTAQRSGMSSVQSSTQSTASETKSTKSTTTLWRTPRYVGPSHSSLIFRQLEKISSPDKSPLFPDLSMLNQTSGAGSRRSSLSLDSGSRPLCPGKPSLQSRGSFRAPPTPDWSSPIARPRSPTPSTSKESVRDSQRGAACPSRIHQLVNSLPPVPKFNMDVDRQGDVHALIDSLPLPPKQALPASVVVTLPSVQVNAGESTFTFANPVVRGPVSPPSAFSFSSPVLRDPVTPPKPPTNGGSDTSNSGIQDLPGMDETNVSVNRVLVEAANGAAGSFTFANPFLRGSSPNPFATCGSDAQKPSVTNGASALNGRRVLRAHRRNGPAVPVAGEQSQNNANGAIVGFKNGFGRTAIGQDHNGDGSANTENECNGTIAAGSCKPWQERYDKQAPAFQFNNPKVGTFSTLQKASNDKNATEDASQDA